MIDLHTLHHFVDTTIYAAAIVLNICLLVIIELDATKSLKSYKRVLQLTCVSDLLVSSVTLFDQPVILNNGVITVFISNGFFRDSQTSTILMLQAAYCWVVLTNFAFLSVPFVYRYVNICRPSKASLILAAVLSMSALISLVGLRTSYGIVDGDMEFKTHAFKAATDVGWLHSEDAMNATTLLGSKLDAPWTFRHILLVFITINLSYTLIILSEWRVFRSLKVLEPSMQASTRRMQSDLHRALIALALCPLFSSFLPTGLLLLAGLLQFQLGTYSAFVTIFMSSITLINPITTCYFVAPFRKAITRLATCKGISKQPTSSVTFLSSTGVNQQSNVTS